MPLTEEEIGRIVNGVAEKLEIKCQCGLSSDARNEMTHFFGMVKDIGNGRYDQGIEVMRDMGKRYNRMSRTSEALSKALMWLFLASMFSGVLYVGKKGVVAIIKAVK
ncbi:hypothetical protein HNR65_002174 [Desulfosalsimonas propionicica]|uniref:Uncharacterized protein n=1 Tax=Desulfosalsimonas propionicica TaxID=332175 RepID=A0A7W0C9X7_9BACT|nr:hypothetical protein [Desulfosalsimonas propionicica]MBA2881843.1 hypothetical protein [Desulfosalsimonas propionicica]